jgi:uncharacterized protein (TIGR03032 family)
VAEDDPSGTARPSPALSVQASRRFAAWLAGTGGSLAFTTFDAGKIFFVGQKPDGQLSFFERTFPRPMGLAAGDGGRRLWLSTLTQLWRFEDFLDPGHEHDGHDAFYVPLSGHTTGDIDIHDLHEDADGRPVFVATLFNCLATIGERSSFVPLWRPRWIDRLAAEDRCHLNGLAMRDGRPAFVTSVGRGNVAESWRERRAGGGVVVDVASGEVVASGLSMPHAPRMVGDALWLQNSGTGELGRVDLATGRFEPVAFLPGFLRGMVVLGGHAVVGLSRPREASGFADLPLARRLAAEGVAPRAGLAVVNLVTGDVEHQVMIEGVVQEIYDIAALPGTRRPKALGFMTEEIRFAIRPGP